MNTAAQHSRNVAYLLSCIRRQSPAVRRAWKSRPPATIHGFSASRQARRLVARNWLEERDLGPEELRSFSAEQLAAEAARRRRLRYTR